MRLELGVLEMACRVIQTNKRLAAERQIHAAISHYRAGEFECAITLSSAAEGQIPTPETPNHALGVLQQHSKSWTKKEKEIFNLTANWLKHDMPPLKVDIAIDELIVKFWLVRAISKYRATYGFSTSEMISVFPWAGQRPSRIARRRI